MWKRVLKAEETSARATKPVEALADLNIIEDVCGLNSQSVLNDRKNDARRGYSD